MLLALPKSRYPGPIVHQDELSDEVLFFKKYYKKKKIKNYYLQFDSHRWGPRSRVCPSKTLPSAPINMSGNFTVHMSATSPSNMCCENKPPVKFQNSN